MSSSRERALPPVYKKTSGCYSVRAARLLLTDLSKVKQSVDGNGPNEHRPITAAESTLDTEGLPVDVKQEFDDGEDLSRPMIVEEDFKGGEDFYQFQLKSSQLNSGQKITYDDPVAMENGDNIPQLLRKNILSSLDNPFVPVTGDQPKSLVKVETDVGLPESDPTPSSSSSATVATSFLPAEVPSSVTLIFEASDEDEASSMSHYPTPSSSGLQSIEADSKDLVDTSLTSKVPAENHDSVSLQSELILPVDNEELRTEEDILMDGRNQLPVFIQGPQDTMFLEEVSMTIRQFNELLENLFLYHYFQAPGKKSRIKLEAVLKFLVRGETIANLAQEYKIAKNTFTKYLHELLDAIFNVLGLLRVKEGKDQWSETITRFTNRLGLPNCCGVINAKSILTWRAPSDACLPVLTLTDADYNILYVDMEACIEDQGIDFKSTRMHMAIHTIAGAYTLKLPKLGFVVGNERLMTSSFIFPLYSGVSVDMPIPHLYNSRLERALRVSENAHGILATKFKIYDKIMTLTPNLAKSVVRATCALHNWLNQNSPGYVTPGLVDVETKGEVALGSWRFAHRQIFQPVPWLHKTPPPGRKNRYDDKRDMYAYYLYNTEQMKKSHNAPQNSTK